MSQPRQVQPPYLRIAGIIREQIEHGELRPGEQVPSVTKIADEYNVSRGTARRALDQLKEWGLTEATPGWGTFVKENA
jgi:DNA-binding GntR family transcriptional regulator